MIKEFGITAYGQVENLIKDLRNINELKIGQTETFVSVRINETQKEIYQKVKEIFQNWAVRDNLMVNEHFRASEFTKQDYAAAEVIKAFFPVFGEVEHTGALPKKVGIENTGVVNVKVCSKCNSEQVSWIGEGTLRLSAIKDFTFPAFTSNFNCSVLREDILEKLAGQNLIADLFIKECEIKTKETIKDRYFVIFPKVDIGLPVGDIEFREKCSLCHALELVNKREFLFCYDKNKIDAHHFTWSSHSPYGQVFISAAAYKVLGKLKEFAKEHNKIFEIIKVS